MALYDLEIKQEQKLDNQLFVATKLTRERLQSFEVEMERIDNMAQTSGFVLNADKKLTAVTRLAEFGTVSLVGTSDEVKAKFLHNLCVKTPADKEDCVVMGVCVLPDGRLAVADFENYSVKTVDVASKQVTERLVLQAKPVAITLVNDHQLVTTVKGERYVQQIELVPSLSLGRTLALPGLYEGLAYSGDRLILACYDPATCIHICDLSGRLLQQIELDTRGDKLFAGRPWGLTVSPDGSSIYVTDWVSHQVLCLSDEGVVKERYVADRLQWPSGVTTDDQGLIYVCCHDDHSIHMLDASCRQGEVFLERKDGLESPLTLTVYGNRLFVSSFGHKSTRRNNLRAYSLLQ